MDAAILVVGATDGCMPQTKEHLLLVRQLGVQHIVVFINKCDVADEEMVELVEMEIRELLTEFGYDGDNTPLIKGSALCAIDGKKPELGKNSILALLDAVDNSVPDPVRNFDEPFLLPVEHVHTITGRGTVVTGRVTRGKLKVGIDVDIVGYDKFFKGKVNGIEMFHKTLDEACAGDQMGILLRGVKKDDVRRGMAVAKPGTIKQYDHFEAQIYILTKDEGGLAQPLAAEKQVLCFSKTWDCAAFIDLKGKEMVMPGEDCSMVLKLGKQMIVEPNQQFTIRLGTSTIGTGKVTKVLDNLTDDQKAYIKMSKKKKDKLKEKEAAQKSG